MTDYAEYHLVSYPKSGKMWLQNMIHVAICEKNNIPYKFGHELELLGNNIGFLVVPEQLITPATHRAGYGPFKFKMDERDLYLLGYYRNFEPSIPKFTHDNHIKVNNGIVSMHLLKQFILNGLTLEHMIFYQERKVLLLIRDPRDIVVSDYFYMKKYRKDMCYRQKNINDSLSKFIKSPTAGIELVINFYDLWHKYKNVPQKFDILKYEELKSNPVNALEKFFDFYGCKKYSKEVLKKAVQVCSFQNMKNHERISREKGKNRIDGEEDCFVRKGKVGGHKDYFSEEDLEYVNEKIKNMRNGWYK